MQATIMAPLIIAVVLIVSGIAKVQAPESTAEAFRELKVPAPLSRPWVIKLFPLAEILLGVAVLVVPAWLGIVVGVAAVALFVAYLLLVRSVLRRGDEADCNCFGGLTSGRITKVTLWRNVVLVLVAVGAVVDISIHGTPALWRIFTDLSSIGWLFGAAVAALVTALIVREEPLARADEDEELLDYIRQPIPYGTLENPAGEQIPLRELARMRPVFLLLATSGCSACFEAVESLPQWRERLPEVDMLVVGDRGSLIERWPDEDEWVYQDNERFVGRLFGSSVPTGVLFGADGLLAGGPVSGSVAINDLLAEVEAQLAEFRDASAEHSG